MNDRDLAEIETAAGILRRMIASGENSGDAKLLADRLLALAGEVAWQAGSRARQAAPGWILGVAETVKADQYRRLSEMMLARDEDITDNALWRLRRQQLDALLASGKVLAVTHGGRMGTSQCERDTLAAISQWTAPGEAET